jgi:UDP-glucuronate 4-epimerase
MNILVTGSAGFIGSNLCDRLVENPDNNIFALDYIYNKYSDSKVKYNNIKNNFSKINYYNFLTTDITNFEDMNAIFKKHKFDMVIHLAALAGVRSSIMDPSSYLSCNYIGTLNILELMKMYDVKKLIFASSSSVYGKCEKNKFSEDIDVSKPLSPYAASKLACEQLIYSYSNLYNIQSLCLRLFTVYGPRQRNDLAIHKFTDLILRDEPIEVYGDGNSLRDYTYIDDIVDGIVASMKYRETKYEIINLGGGHPVKLIDMITILYGALKKQTNIKFLPLHVSEMNKTISDNSKAEKLLSFYPKINFENGIDTFVKWFKENYNFYVK